MKSTTKVLLIALLLIVSSIPCQAKLIELTGVIKCKESNKVISNAFINAEEYFTYSNEVGEFILRVPETKLSKLEVYHSGYQSFSLNLTENTVNLPSHQILLAKADPTATPHMNGKEIMQEVFKRFHINYELEDQLMLAYCKESLSSNQKIHHLAEGIFQAHISSNVERGPTLLRPLKTRIQSNIESDRLNQMSGYAADMFKSWTITELFSKKNQWNYRYRFVGKEIYRENNVLLIDFVPKNIQDYVIGTIWVDEFSLAIIRVEYHLAESSEWDSESWTEEFQHNKHTYYLCKATMEGHWKESGTAYTFKTIVVNTNIQTNKEDQVPFEKFIPASSLSFAHNSHGQFTDEYWGGLNYLKLTDTEREFIK